MISHDNKSNQIASEPSDNTLIQGPQARTNFRCSKNLKDALRRSEELLHRAEELQKEFGRKSSKA